MFKERIREALRLAKVNGYTQAKIGEKAGVSPQAVGQWPRTGKVSIRNLAILAHLAGKPLEWFGLNQGDQQFKQIEQEAEALAALATPRSQQALDYITQAAREGRLTEDDLLMLEQIAQRIAAQPAKTTSKGHNTKTTRERIAENVTDADNDTQGT